MNRWMKTNKWMKWIGALLAVIMLLAVAMTGAMAEEEFGLITEQIESEVIPAIEETVDGLPEITVVPEEEKETELSAEESSDVYVSENIFAPTDTEGFEIAIVETGNEAAEADEAAEAVIPETVVTEIKPNAEFIEAEETEVPAEAEEAKESEAPVEAEEEAPVETEEAEESETPTEAEEAEEAETPTEAEEAETPAETEDAAEPEGSDQAEVPEAETSDEQEEAPKYKNGNEGFHVESSSEIGFYDGKINAGFHKNDDKSGRNVDINLMHVQISTNANAGEFTALTPDNVVVRGKGYHAGASAEITVLETSADFRVGSTKNNIHGSFEIEAASLKGGAEFTVGETNGNPVAGITLSGEADLVTAKISGGCTVSGVKVDGHVGAKLGVGGRLQAGIHDGKIGIHGSFAVGIGFEAGIDVDLSSITNKILKAEETVASTISSVKNWFKRLW